MVIVEAPTRSAREILSWSRAECDPALRAAVGSLPASMRRVAEYHFGWRDEDGKPSGATAGKAVRPALTLLTASALGAARGAAVPAAVAVELVHNFSLLHDDVMDGDLTRRHRATAWAVFGANPAILAGDALLTLAFDVLGEAAVPVRAAHRPAARALGECVHRLLDGQSADLEFEERDRVEVTEGLRMSAAKTGALLGCACAMGALYGEAAVDGDLSDVTRLRTFGEKVGLAFQFVDDLLGIWGEPAVTGKPVHSDLANRKKSLPVVRALAGDGEASSALAALYHRAGPLSPVELAEAAALIEDTGARAWCQEQADRLVLEALVELPASRVTARGAAELTAMAEVLTRRDH
jgi:geranylgeranyl diphosphate synthase type I